MKLTRDGALGLGSTTPGAKMDIITGSNRYALRLGENTANTDGSWTGIKFQLSTNTSNSDTQDGAVSIRANRYSAGSQLQILNGSTIIGTFGGASSSLMLGTTTDLGYKLDVSGSVRFTNGLTVTGSTTITGSFNAIGASGSIAVGTGGSLSWLGIKAVDWQNRVLRNSSNAITLDWETGNLTGTSSFASTASSVTSLNQTVQITGSLQVEGTIYQNGYQINPYTIYEALITQSGSSAGFTLDTGTLTIGVTYYIANPSPGMDFTNVGAPDNTVGTYFVATDTDPTSWGSNEDTGNDTLSYDTGAPIVLKVLENTIGNVWYIYNSAGQYSLMSNSLFTDNSTFTTIGNDRSYIQNKIPAQFNQIRPRPGANDEIFIESFTIDADGNGDLQDSMMTLGTPLQVKVAL
jgi:hypothetical protein